MSLLRSAQLSHARAMSRESARFEMKSRWINKKYLLNTKQCLRTRETLRFCDKAKEYSSISIDKILKSFNLVAWRSLRKQSLEMLVSFAWYLDKAHILLYEVKYVINKCSHWVAHIQLTSWSWFRSTSISFAKFSTLESTNVSTYSAQKSS